jgi:hypothetical protein
MAPPQFGGKVLVDGSSLGQLCQAAEEVRPAEVVHRPQVGSGSPPRVDDVDAAAGGAERRDRELHRRRHAGLLGADPGHRERPRRLEARELAGHDALAASEGEAEATPCPRLELRNVGPPADELALVGQQLEHPLGGGAYLDAPDDRGGRRGSLRHRGSSSASERSASSLSSQ